MKHKSVALDGPSGAGKSSMAKKVAAELGYIYVDTGAIYRTIGLMALEKGLDPADPKAVIPMLPDVSVRMEYEADGLQHMFLGERDVTEDIRTPAVSVAASQISAIPAVRSFLLEMQRDLAQRHDVVMDGRDIGTVVLPAADAKIFLTASSEERARRRYKELAERGEKVEYAQVLADLIARDQRDTNREAAPLRQAKDAVAVDTTGLGLEESFRLILKKVKEQLGE